MRFIVFLTGYGLAVAGGITLIMYMNLVAMGMSWADYLSFATSRPECYLFFIGWLLIFFSLKE